MAFDAGFLSAIIAEIKTSAVGGRIEKVYQPRADEIVLQMRGREGGKKLLFRGEAQPGGAGLSADDRGLIYCLGPGDEEIEFFLSARAQKEILWHYAA